MTKKSRKGKIKAGIFEYEWYKEIDKIDADFELIKSQIDSFLYIIENPKDFKSSVYIEEMSVFFDHCSFMKISKESLNREKT